ncbi:MAG TPA: DUF4065 domain-containing protein [Firmicutes bacterium]|nr:DUF4065 domain-containing protein [Bacillota bacterium]
MGKKITFCEECRKDVPYSVESGAIKGTLKGEEYEFIGGIALCGECGAEVYVAEIEDGNLKALYDVYRQKNDIISLEKVRQIPEKYDIGKRPLSLLLGWGEMTFSRYYDGDIPTKQYADVLQRIYQDPAYYLSLLEQNKGNLKSQAAYRRSRRATEALLGRRKSGVSKMNEAVDYLLFQCEDITPLALQGLLYYIQGFYYAFTGDFLFAEDCEAWVHGPVYREIYNHYRSYCFNPIEGNEEFDISVFTDTEKAVIDSIIQNFACYSGKILEQFTHSEMPWMKTRGDLPSNTPSNRIISKDLIGTYFVAVKERYEMLTPDDIENYAQVLFRRAIRI